MAARGYIAASSSGSQAAFDEARNRVVIFGGDDDRGLLSDTWEWDGETWARRG